MMNWITYKDKTPLNLDHYNKISRLDFENLSKFKILFGNGYAEWIFNTKEERDAVLEGIKSIMQPVDVRIKFNGKEDNKSEENKDR